MQQTMIGAALSNFSLFNAASGSQDLLRSISAISGISVPELLHAERRIQRMQSYAPIRELLTNPMIQRADKFKFKIGLKQIHRNKATPREKVGSLFLLEIHTAKGRIDIEIVMLMKLKYAGATPKQVAQIQLNYKIHQGNEIRTHTQKLRIADNLPVWRETRKPNVEAVAA